MDDSPMYNNPIENALMVEDNFENILDFATRNGLLEITGLEEMNLASIDLEPVPSTSSNSLRSSLPAVGNWPGFCDFHVSFPPQDNTTQTNWIFSERENKLYVKKDIPCPFTFQVNHLIPRSVMLRVYAIFTRPDHATDAVVRCVQHSMEEIQRGIKEAEYLVRSASTDAFYEIDARTEALSVLLPLVNLSGPSLSFTHVFKFLCFTSCAGGPNRRPLTLVFSLEDRNAVIGRYCIHLKVCSSPKRDLKLSEAETLSTETSKVPLVELKNHEIFPASRSNEAKKNGKKQEFVIKVKDEKCYRYLKEMEKLFATGVIMKCKHLISSSSDEATDSNFEI